MARDSTAEHHILALETRSPLRLRLPLDGTTHHGMNVSEARHIRDEICFEFRVEILVVLAGGHRPDRVTRCPASALHH
jgi:hypothetical protein